MVARRNVIGTPLFRRNRHRIVLSGKFAMPACLQPSSTRIPCVFFLLIGSLLDLRTRKGLCIAAVPFALLASSIVRDVNR